jgi:hypothetical protein
MCPCSASHRSCPSQPLLLPSSRLTHAAPALPRCALLRIKARYSCLTWRGEGEGGWQHDRCWLCSRVEEREKEREVVMQERESGGAPQRERVRSGWGENPMRMRVGKARSAKCICGWGNCWSHFRVFFFLILRDGDSLKPSSKRAQGITVLYVWIQLRTPSLSPWRVPTPWIQVIDKVQQSYTNLIVQLSSGYIAFALFSLLKILMFSPLSPSHHIKYAKRHKFGVLNIGKK